jgi:hypothetical protein
MEDSAVPDRSPRHARSASRSTVEAANPLFQSSSFAVREAGESRGPSDPATSLDTAVRLGHSFGADEPSSPPLIQTKLRVGAPRDKYEQEADRIGFQVMNRARGADGLPQGDGASPRPAVDRVTPIVAPASIQRSADEEQSASGAAHSGEAFEADSALQERLVKTRGGGIPLPVSTREFLEPRMGGDFSQVRVHRDTEAKQLNRELSSVAFTHGPDIYVGEAGFAPGSSEETQLFAHELTHVMQQAQAGASQEGSLPIQRFSQASLDNGSWVNETASVKRPAQGASGGVYFFESATGDMPELVVKPEKVASQAAVLMAETFLSEAMKVNVAETKRTVFKGSPEGDAIEAVITNDYISKVTNLPQKKALTEDLEDTQMFLIQPKVQGASISALASKATDAAKVNGFIAQLSDQRTLVEIGQLIVADAFISNRDRISTQKANLGNLIIANGVIAIDNEAWFRKVEESDTSGFIKAQTELLTDLYDKPDAIIKNFYDGIQDSLNKASSVNFNAWAYFQSKYDFEGAVFALRFGIKKGLDNLGIAIRGRTRTRDEMKRLGRLGQAEAHWDAYRVREQYLKLLRRDVPTKTAQQTAEKYHRYRAKRAALPKGLKFLAKVYKPSLPS